MRTTLSLFATLLSLSLPPIAKAETIVQNGCFGNAFEACLVLIEGEIEPGLTERLEALAENGIDGRSVYFNSPGGSLGEALRLGRWLRENGFDTDIGGSDGIPRGEDGRLEFLGSEGPKSGVCESACAYAYMGGVARYLGEEDKLGLHQFHAPGQEIGSDTAQKFSGELVSYMVEMGVDARIFSIASGQTAEGMTYVTREQAEQFDLVSAKGYDRFFLEPYKNGIIAAARRLDPPGPYSGVDQISFFCRGGTPYALIHAAIHGLSDDSQGSPDVRINGQLVEMKNDALSIRLAGREAYLTLRLTAQIARAIAASEFAIVGASFGRVEGGQYTAVIEPEEIERQMIASAFRFCID